MTHAEANLKKFLEDGTIQRSDAETLTAKVRKALSFRKYRKSTAVVVRLSRKVSQDYGHREFWGESDLLVAIVRHGKVRTVMLSRESQNHTDHFRTDNIFS